MNKIEKLIARLLIPKGYYCHSSENFKKKCPFWFIDSGKEEQRNGYCSYLEKSDDDINNEYPEMIEVNKRQPDGSYKKELMSKYEEPIFNSFSMLWDQCKECGVKMKWK